MRPCIFFVHRLQDLCEDVRRAEEAHAARLTANSEEILGSLLEALDSSRSAGTRGPLLDAISAMAELAGAHEARLVATASAGDGGHLAQTLGKGLLAVVRPVEDILTSRSRKAYTWKERASALRLVRNLAVLPGLRGPEGPLGEHRATMIRGAVDCKRDSVAAVREAAVRALGALEASEAETANTRPPVLGREVGRQTVWHGAAKKSEGPRTPVPQRAITVRVGAVPSELGPHARGKEGVDERRGGPMASSIPVLPDDKVTPSGTDRWEGGGRDPRSTTEFLPDQQVNESTGTDSGPRQTGGIHGKGSNESAAGRDECEGAGDKRPLPRIQARVKHASIQVVGLQSDPSPPSQPTEAHEPSSSPLPKSRGPSHSHGALASTDDASRAVHQPGRLDADSVTLLRRLNEKSDEFSIILGTLNRKLVGMEQCLKVPTSRTSKSP